MNFRWKNAPEVWDYTVLKEEAKMIADLAEQRNDRHTNGFAVTICSKNHLSDKLKGEKLHWDMLNVLHQCPEIQKIWDYFDAPKLSFRLMCRSPHGGRYRIHTDRRVEIEGGVRIEIPLQTSPDVKFCYIDETNQALMAEKVAQVHNWMQWEYDDMNVNGLRPSSMFEEDFGDFGIVLSPYEVGKIYRPEIVQSHTVINDGTEDHYNLVIDLGKNQFMEDFLWGMTAL